jgi:hypothetical protein
MKKKRSWLNLTYYSGICLEILREIMINFREGIRYPGRDSNLVTFEHGSEASLFQLTSSNRGAEVFLYHHLVLCGSEVNSASYPISSAYRNFFIRE